MTLYLNFRQGAVGGPIAGSPWILDGDGLAATPSMKPRWTLAPGTDVGGRHVVIATHGFNVSYRSGLAALAALERELKLQDEAVFIGVLWPGDFWIPFVNYPAEAKDAVICGQGLAAFANDQLQDAGAISFVSHSLGARVVLEAVLGMRRRAHQVVLAAAAADDNCLTTYYDRVCDNADRVTVLASRKDLALRVAYRVGDAVSDVAYRDTDDAWRCALGFHGPRPNQDLDRVSSRQLPDAAPYGYGHGDYYPTPAPPNPRDVKRRDSVKYIRASLLGGQPGWPP